MKPPTKPLRATVLGLTLAALVAIVFVELRKPPGERTWHGYLFGFLPYDLRPPTLSRSRSTWWNPGEERILVPRDFGIGWAINLYRVKALALQAVRALRSLRSPASSDSGR
jgi:hypothetical protein